MESTLRQKLCSKTRPDPFSPFYLFENQAAREPRPGWRGL